MYLGVLRYELKTLLLLFVSISHNFVTKFGGRRKEGREEVREVEGGRWRRGRKGGRGGMGGKERGNSLESVAQLCQDDRDTATFQNPFEKTSF